MSLEMLKHDLRASAIASLKAGSVVLSTVDHYSTMRFQCNLRPESTEPIFDTTSHTSQSRELKAFETALGEVGSAAGFGPNTTFTPKHTNMQRKRRPNDDGQTLVKGILLEALPVKTPKTTTNSGTITDDNDDKSYLAPDPSNFVRDWCAKAVATDYSFYVQKSGGSKERLGPISWEATESGILYALFAYPEGWMWGGTGAGAEMIVGAELVHKTYNEEWVADTDRPTEDIIEGLTGVAGSGSQPSADTLHALFDVCVRFVGASGARLVG